MDWIIETEFDYDKNMWRSMLRYSSIQNEDGSIRYNRLCSSLHPDKQPSDSVLEYFEKKKKGFTDFLTSFKQLANDSNTHNQE